MLLVRRVRLLGSPRGPLQLALLDRGYARTGDACGEVDVVVGGDDGGEEGEGGEEGSGGLHCWLLVDLNAAVVEETRGEQIRFGATESICVMSRADGRIRTAFILVEPTALLHSHLPTSTAAGKRGAHVLVYANIEFPKIESVRCIGFRLGRGVPAIGREANLIKAIAREA